MLNRRILRIKVMQALYAFFQSEAERAEHAVERLLKNIYSIYELYIYQLSFVIEIIEFAKESIEISKNKFFPTEEEKNPNTRFIDNSIISKIANNPDFLKRYHDLHINWSEQKDLIRRIFLQIKESDFYDEYMRAPECNATSDYKILARIVDDFLVPNEELQQYYEEMNINWANDYDVACYMVVKTFKKFANSKNDIQKLPKLIGTEKNDDEKEEILFIRDLFLKTIVYSADFEKIIEKRLENWEIDRIAMMDMILIKMALCEFIHFETIPTKVTINEYLEISKFYSTPKSKIFINGLLDKLLFDLKSENKIRKTGRGLIE